MNDFEKVSIIDILNKKVNKQPITMLTAFDYPSAMLLDKAKVDIILVGDTLAMTVLGYSSTVSITMDEMLHHCKAVTRGAKRSFIIGDMPFLSYHTSCFDAIKNAGRFIKESNVDAVKLEGGRNVIDKVKAIVQTGIPIMGHIGLTPQTATKLGGYKVQGKDAEHAQNLLDDARALEDAGCFAMVLEAVPAPVAKVITESIAIPTIGIGAGVHCDGQVLVYNDMLGLFEEFTPKFVKKYADLHNIIMEAIQEYCNDIRTRQYPTDEHSYKISKTELEKFLKNYK